MDSVMSELLAEVRRQREATEANTIAVRELADAIASRRRRRAPEPELPAGHRYNDAPASYGPSTASDLEQLRQALAWGWDDQAPPRPRGCKPVLFDHRMLAERLAAGASVEDILDVVRGAAEMVEAGKLDPEKAWKSTYLFSRFFEQVQNEIKTFRDDRRAAAENRRRLEVVAADVAPAGALITPELADAARRRFATATTGERA